MKNIFKLLFFILYVITIFIVKNYLFLILFILMNFIISRSYKVEFFGFLRNTKTILFLIVFTTIFNMIFDSARNGIFLGIRILIAYNFSCIFSKIFNILEFAQTIEKILKPLCIFKIDSRDISIMISMSICMIPILNEELNQLKSSLKSKGYKFKINNLDTYMKPIMISILKKADELENSLIVKGYQE